MLKLSKLGPRLWVDENNTIYKKKGHTRIVASDGRILRAPKIGEKIFLDGKGNGLLFM